MGLIIGNGIGIPFNKQSELLSSYWIPQSAVVENAAPTDIVLTYDKKVKPTDAVTTNFAVVGKTISSATLDGTGKILTLVVSVAFAYGDSITVVANSENIAVANNITYWGYVKNIFSGHIIASYPLNEASGSVAEDDTNGYDGAYQGTPVLNQTGLFGGKAAHMNAAGNVHVYTSDFASAWANLTGFFSCWIKCDTDEMTDTSMFLFKVQNAANMYVGIKFQGNGDMYGYHMGSGTLKNLITTAPYGSRWFNIAFKWDKSVADRIYVYINGVSQQPPVLANVTTLGAITGSPATSASNMFCDSDKSGKFDGLTQYAFFLNYAPTDADILKIVNPLGICVFEGDSRTTYKKWTSKALELSRDGTSDFGFEKLGYSNAATSGARIQVEITNRVATVNALKIAGSSSNILVLWAGVNSTSYNATQIYNALKTYCQNAKSAGWNKVVICSEIDAQDATRNTWGWHSTVWPALNAALDADNSFADAYANLGADARLQDATDTTYFDADKLHLTDAGYEVVRGIVQAVL